MLKYRCSGALALLITVVFVLCLLHVDNADWLSRNHSPESFKAAIRAVPEDWQLYEGLADTSPSDGLSAMRQAVKLNPMYGGIRSDLAARAEAAHLYPEAEANLIKAIALDHTSAPKVQLAEFYFRRRDAEHFWPATRSAFNLVKSLPTPLLEDCWQLTSRSGMILDTVPKRSDNLLQYLEFLLEEKHEEAAPAVALAIMQQPEQSWISSVDVTFMRGVMTRYCDELASQGSLLATVIWNWEITNKFIAYEPLSLQTGKWATNAEFRIVPASAGFDWRLENIDGVFINHLPSQHMLQLSFSGKQPEHCDILSQYFPLWPGRHYHFHANYEDLTIDKLSGLRWRIILPSGAELATSPESPQINQDFSFVAPSETTVGKLVMSYDRTPGTVRIEGDMQIRSVEAKVE